LLDQLKQDRTGALTFDVFRNKLDLFSDTAEE